MSLYSFEYEDKAPNLKSHLLDVYCCKSYCQQIGKIPIISPGLIFVPEAFLLGLFSGEFIFGWAYYWTKFCVLKWVGPDNTNSLKR